MIDRRTLAACCVLAIPYAACFAQTSYSADTYFDNRWYITPFGTYINADSNRHADNGWGGGISIGKPISPSWNIELRTQYEELDGKFGGPFSGNKFKNWSGSIDAQWFFMGRTGFRLWQSNSIQPYLVGGIGAIEDRISGGLVNENTTGFMANAGWLAVVWPFFHTGPPGGRRTLPLRRQQQKRSSSRHGPRARLAVHGGSADPLRASSGGRAGAPSAPAADAGPASATPGDAQL